MLYPPRSAVGAHDHEAPSRRKTGTHRLRSHIHIQSGQISRVGTAKNPRFSEVQCIQQNPLPPSWVILSLPFDLVSIPRQVDLHTVENIEEWDHNGFWFLYSTFFERKGYKLYVPKIASSSDYYTPVSQPAIASGPLPMYAFFSHHDSEDLHTPRVAVRSPAYRFLMHFLSCIFSSARSLLLKTGAARTSLSN